MDFLRRLIALMRDPRTPKLQRYMVIAAVIYAISPIDLVPEAFVPVAGWIDDLIVMWMSVRWLFNSAPPPPKHVTPSVPARELPGPPPTRQ
jgi:uncharacterized membrane protein YkvA (DUF1232 family)